MATCQSSTGHCCHLGPFGVCPALRDDGPDASRRWVCTLREREGSWARVHGSVDYIASGIEAVVRDLTGGDCGDWPPKGMTCAECGVTGA